MASTTTKEIDDINKLLKLDPSNTELLAQKYHLLQQQIEETTIKLEALKEADRQAKKQLEAGDLGKEKYDALQREILETEQSLEELQCTVGSGNSAMAQISASAGTVKPLSNSAAEFVEKAVDAVSKTEGLRSALSKLDQNARESGAGVDAAREAFNAFTVVCDDTDSSIEATSRLLQAGFTESSLQQAVENLSGACLRFPDTMNIGSLAASMQETLKTGIATGQFAQLLDDLGISAGLFAQGLAQCATDAERQNYALQTLASTGLADTYNSWKQNNQALVEHKEANQSFQEAMVEFAEVITPILTLVTQFLGDMLQKFNNLSPAAQIMILSILGIVAALAPLLNGIAGIASGVSALAGLLSTSSGLGAVFSALGTVAGTVFGGIKTVVMGLFSLIAAHPVIAIITAIIAAILYLWNNCEWFRDGVIALWNGIKDSLSAFWDWISSKAQSTWTWLCDFLAGAWDNISSKAQSTWTWLCDSLAGLWNDICSNAQSIWNGLCSLLAGLWESISSTAQSVWSWISGLFASIWSGMGSVAQSVAETIGNIIGNIWGAISDLIAKAWTWGADFIGGLVSGIQSKVGSVIGAVKGIAGKISEFLHFSRPDKGPLHEYEKWMPDFMEGLASGIQRNAHLVTASVQNVAEGMRLGVNGAGMLAPGYSDSGEMLSVLKQYLPYLAHGMELRLDTGALVGATAPSMNAALGKISARELKR